MKRFAIVSAVCCLLGLAGCTADQVANMDRAMGDVNDVGQVVRQVVDSPAGQLIPATVRQIMYVLGVGATAAFGIWQKIRADVEKQTTRGVIASVDTLLISDQVTNTKKAKQLLADDQGTTLAAKVKKLKES